jgi:hypothetical protein
MTGAGVSMSTRGMLDRMFSHGELFDFPRWVELEKRFLKI